MYDEHIESLLEIAKKPSSLGHAYKHMPTARNLEGVGANACFLACGAYHGYGPVQLPGEWH